MRNKKLILAATLILTISVLLCAFAGCQKEVSPAEIPADEEVNPADILLSFYNSDAKFKVESQELTNLKDYTIISYSNNMIVARKYDENNNKYTYALFDIEDNKVVATSESNFNRIIYNVFATYEVVEEERVYTFYDRNGVIKSSVKQGEYTTSLNSQINFADGTVVISTLSGTVIFDKTLDNAMNIANFHNAEAYEYGDIIIIENSEGESYLVFDTDGNYKYSLNVSALLNTSDDDVLNVRYLGKSKMAIQVLTELTDVEAQSGFDFVDDGEFLVVSGFCKMTTYIYDFESRTLAETEYDKIILDTIMSKDEEYALIYAFGITPSKRVASNFGFFVTDNDLNEILQLNDIVNNASNFSIIDESTYVISDDMIANVFDEKGNLVKSYSYNNDYVSSTQAGFLKVGNNFYDVKGNEVFKLDPDAEWMNIFSDGLIYYVIENSDESLDFCIYDTKTNVTATYDYQKYSSIGEYSLLFTISDEDGNIQIFSCYTGQAISPKKFARASVRMSGDYYIITATEEDGEITYFSYYMN